MSELIQSWKLLEESCRRAEINFPDAILDYGETREIERLAEWQCLRSVEMPHAAVHTQTIDETTHCVFCYYGELDDKRLFARVHAIAAKAGKLMDLSPELFGEEYFLAKPEIVVSRDGGSAIVPDPMTPVDYEKRWLAFVARTVRNNPEQFPGIDANTFPQTIPIDLCRIDKELNADWWQIRFRNLFDAFARVAGWIIGQLENQSLPSLYEVDVVARTLTVNGQSKFWDRPVLLLLLEAFITRDRLDCEAVIEVVGKEVQEGTIRGYASKLNDELFDLFPEFPFTFAYCNAYLLKEKRP